jgi:sulfite dehydrogenase (quinone) subunit SoeC
MRPAYSVILFTTLSGAGYGLMAVLGALLLLGWAPATPGTLIAPMMLGLVFAAVGLISSVFHLGRPERAWLAFSQWRTSWLSREGVAAVAVFVTALPLGALLLRLPAQHFATRVLGGTTSALALATIICTAMIYASLKPVPQWQHPTVLPAYLLLGLATGTLVLEAVLLITGVVIGTLRWLALASLAGAWSAKELYWRATGDKLRSFTASSAVGLDRFGTVRLLDAPHTESNYLLHEMGYRVGRQHAAKLRTIARASAFGLPILLTLPLLAPGFLPLPAQVVLACLAATSALIGALVERWLFFAEARHTVILYYGAQAI